MNRQRGALTFIVPLIMVIIVLFGTLAIDGARLYSLRQDMQSQVNAAATAAADSAHSCSSFSSVQTAGQIQIMAEDAAKASGWDGKGKFQVSTGVIEGDEGSLDFRPADVLQANAVAVRYERDVPMSLLLPDRFANLTMTVSAAAKKEVLATLSAAGTTAVVGGSTGSATVLNSLLGALFNGGQPYAFSPTDLNQLADVTVRLGDLLDQTGVGGVVNSLPVDAEALAENLSGVLGALSPAGRLADDLLDTAVGLDGVSVEQVLKLAEEGAVVPENASIPVYDLLMSLALNTLEGTSVMLENIGVSVPGLAEVDAHVDVFKAPSVVVAPARQDQDGEWLGHVETADVAIRLATKIDTNLTILGTGLRARIDLPLDVETGSGEADLVRARCASGTGNDVVFGLTGRIGIAGIDGAADINVQLQLLGIPITLLGLRLNVDLPVDGGPFDIETDPISLNAVEEQNFVRGGDLQLGGLSDANLSIEGSAHAASYNCGLICGAVNVLLSPIVALLNGVLQSSLLGLITSILEAVINPLLSALGLDLGVMNVAVTDAQQGRVVLIEGLQEDAF
ncbi:pilus assembly protein TadG-related protein [Alcanivorax marinus]|uniref:Pilus assembly protein TadG-related protein n=1 Tax=Alloalcanivorax marinus TaxID=1177169 RepID=A0A9Q3YPL6_9GAMM|nr:pilus assembly protein TadG-related protein [Alloalcanivorax marinus]MCC4310021.1 pilus assembly protein TadG-related protein [Alloalcanivorax marinus]MCU5787518.1 hypothetical protein [Alloalcanivorax marinus]